MLYFGRAIYHRAVTIKVRASGTVVGKNAKIAHLGKIKISSGSTITIGDDVILSANYSIDAHAGSNIQIGARVHFGESVRINADHGASIIIEEGCSFNHNVSINALESIRIGHDSIFGPYVYIGDHNHQSGKNELIKTQGFDTQSLVVGSDVWMGVGATVLKGSFVGDGAIIAARAVVNKTIPPYEIWAGIPAKKIGERQ